MDLEWFILPGGAALQSRGKRCRLGGGFGGGWTRIRNNIVGHPGAHRLGRRGGDDYGRMG